DWIPISEPLYSVLDVAMQVSGLSGGAFDVTVGPLVNLWGFGPDGRRTDAPPEEDIAAARVRSGYRNLELDAARRAVRKRRPDLYVDLSAIAQGYGADEVGRYLERIGVRNYMAEVAGEIRAAGVNADGQAWRIGIERPGSGAPVVERVVELRNAGLATSGDYRNYFERDGVRYSHHIDPATGRPVTHNLASVTVVHKSTVFADAMSTALLVLGPEEGLALAEREKLAAFLIMRSGPGFIEKYTEAFRGLLTE
ncbi:MAG: FAD:protein FMN transferase, partial [Gammaproteobacteria bacterium]|nr:FAD:protein FMN transferase [Gammaproteobacteria bacterium]